MDEFEYSEVEGWFDALSSESLENARSMYDAAQSLSILAAKATRLLELGQTTSRERFILGLLAQTEVVRAAERKFFLGIIQELDMRITLIERDRN